MKYNFTFVVGDIHLLIIVGGCGIASLIFVVVLTTLIVKLRNRNQSNTNQKGGGNGMIMHDIGPKNELVSLRAITTAINKENSTFPAEKQFEELELNDERRVDHYPSSVGRRYNSKHAKRSLNVFPDVIPYDSTRVILRNTIRGVDYINATWLNRAEEEGPYAVPIMTPYLPFSKINIITTQNPMPQTMEHYYQMLYENYIQVVVDICTPECFDFNEIQSENTQQFNHLEVKMSQGKLVTPFLASRFLEVHNSNDKHIQRLRLFRFIEWPKMVLVEKTAEERKNLVSTISLLRNMIGKDNTTANIVVQDANGGVGGAAVFVILLQLLQAVDESIDKADADGQLSSDAMANLNVFQTVNVMRKKRAKLIHTLAEYRFMSDCLLGYVQDKPDFDNIKIEDFHNSKVLEESIYFT